MTIAGNTALSTEIGAASEGEDTMWTVKDTARFLKASVTFVYRAAERGDIPSVRIGSMRRFDPAVIKAWARGEETRSGTVVAFKQKRG